MPQGLLEAARTRTSPQLLEFVTYQAVAQCAQSLKKHQQMYARQQTSGHIQPSAHSHLPVSA